MAGSNIPQWQKIEYGNLPNTQVYQVDVPDFIGMVNSFQSANTRPNTDALMERIRQLETNQQSYQMNQGTNPHINVPDLATNPFNPNTSVYQQPNSIGSNTQRTNTNFSGSTQEIQQAMYNRLRTQLNHRDAMAVMGNIGAETGWSDKYFFGNHQDGSKRAYGAFSWQGGRETRLLDNLRSQGLLDANGNIHRNLDVVNTQADHILWELQNNEKGSWNRYQKGNYQDILEASRAFNNSVVRSSKDAKVLAGRESKYQDMMRQADLFERQYNQMNQVNNNPTGNGGSTSNVSNQSNWRSKRNDVVGKDWQSSYNFGIDGFDLRFADGKNYKVSSPYGSRHHLNNGGSKEHYGLDIATPMNTGVLAPIDGIYKSYFDKNGGGNVAEIYDPVSRKTVQFFHGANPLPFKNGATIKKGQLFFNTGNSRDGSRTWGSHLDIRVHDENGQYYDIDGTYRSDYIKPNKRKQRA